LEKVHGALKLAKNQHYDVAFPKKGKVTFLGKATVRQAKIIFDKEQKEKLNNF